MAWQDNLLEASLDDFVFDCLATDDKFTRAHAVHSYPYMNGAELEDMGLDAVPISISAIFFGDGYETQLQNFLTICRKPGFRNLVHPVFGVVQVLLAEFAIHHEADNVDQASVSLSFIQNTTAAGFFERTLTVQKANAIATQNTVVREAATEVMAEQVLAVKNTEDFNRISQLRTTMTSVLTQFKTQVAGIVSSGLDPVNFASSWATDLTAVITAIVDLRGFDASTLTADWKNTFLAFDNAILLPAQPRQPQRDQDVIAAHAALEQANGKADTVAIVLASEAETPTMSAPEIETIINEVRTDIQAVIDQYRALYGVEKSRLVTEPLKDIALAVQEAAREVIEARPPLIKRSMVASGNYRLIAHRLYGDHTRAEELLRLNPQIRMPNFIDTGDVINAYAQ